MQRKVPPGPTDGAAGRILYQRFLDDPLSFALQMSREYDGFAYALFGFFPVYFVSRPDIVREVLATRMKSFYKLRKQVQPLARVEGDGMVCANGESWKRSRTALQPAFQPRHFGPFIDTAVELTTRRMEKWASAGSFDLENEANYLVFEINGRILLSADWSAHAARMREAVETFRMAIQKESVSMGPSSKRFTEEDALARDRAANEINSLIHESIEDRRRREFTNDLYSLALTESAEVLGGVPLTDQEIRDEVATLFIAGHDATSAALTWLLYCLARYPDVQQQVIAEVDRELGGRPIKFADASRLKYTEMVVKESTRLYPASAFLFAREAIENTELGGYPVQKGSWVVISPYAAHRDPRIYPDPERFNPLRFSAECAAKIPSMAYLTFGAGPRTCVGYTLAIAEMISVAATILQKYRLELVADQPEVEPMLEVVLRPSERVIARAVERTATVVA